MKQIITCYLCKIDKYWKKFIFIKNLSIWSQIWLNIFLLNIKRITKPWLLIKKIKNYWIKL